MVSTVLIVVLQYYMLIRYLCNGRFVMYHTRQLVAMVKRFPSVTHLRVQLDYDSLFDRFRTEFPKDLAQILSFSNPHHSY